MLARNKAAPPDSRASGLKPAEVLARRPPLAFLRLLSFGADGQNAPTDEPIALVSIQIGQRGAETPMA